MAGNTDAPDERDRTWPPPAGEACHPTKRDVDEAKTLYKLAKSAHDTSNYADAVRYYRDAYRRDCSAHLLLSNMGKAYEADGQYALAIESYRLYRERGRPTGEDLDRLDAKIANLTRRLPATATEPTATATPAASAPSDAPPSATSASSAPSDYKVSLVPPPAPATRHSTLGPWITIGVGGAAAIAGAVITGIGEGDVVTNHRPYERNECRTAIPVTAECARWNRDGNSAADLRTAGIVTMAAGGVVAVGGLVWYFLTPSSRSSPKHGRIELVPGPTLAGIGLSGSF